MNILQRFEHWGDAHHPKWLDLIRIVLGAFLFYKGIDFLNNSSTITGPLSTKTSFGNFSIIVLSHYVVFAHVLCGPLIALGLLTRIMCAVQLPILIGAVIMVNFPKGFLSVGNHMELEVSILVLVGLITFMVFGAGRFSIDEKRRKEKAAESHSAG